MHQASRQSRIDFHAEEIPARHHGIMPAQHVGVARHAGTLAAAYLLLA
jgi:hypothetical protein